MIANMSSIERLNSFGMVIENYTNRTIDLVSHCMFEIVEMLLATIVSSNSMIDDNYSRPKMMRKWICSLKLLIWF